ncbi:MAG: hypothetical protein U0X40_04560 [Ferruginibacter sp.]
MKDKKSILLLVLSFLLLVLSCALLWAWGFRVIRASNTPVARYQTDTIRLHDTAFASTDINAMRSNADSLKLQLDAKLNEFNQLRNDINALLSRSGEVTDSSSSTQRISTLQQVVDNLRNRNRDVENENKRLRLVLDQLTGYLKNAPGKRAVFTEPADATDTQAALNATGYAVSDMRLTAINGSGPQEEETNDATQTARLVCSFTVRNAGNHSVTSEVVVVLTQPDGKVLQTSPWESGVFNTAQGRRVYSCKTMLDLSRGEARKLSFTLNAVKYPRGNYTLQVFHNGTIIGRLNKTLG